MKRISPYTAAAVLILSRLYAYALYIPAEGEYAGVTALGCLLMNMIKLVLLIPLILVCKAKSSEQKEYHTNRPAALLMGGSAFAALTAAGLGFWTLCRSVYPDRLSSIGVPVIWFAACAYIASMGMGSISRSAGFMVFAFTGVILLTFIGMRHNMLSDRVYIYSDNYPRELSSVLLRQSTALYDIPLLYGLLPYTRQSTGKSVGIYLTFDTVISMIVFFMY
ncbi:MAG: hypothetical protein IJ723_07715, partial [Ruminococcus sp.]|nr:hypothetical protein [Ruminococcus sp.]